MITFAIPTWNRAEKLSLCLSSICEQVKKRRGFEVVIANNASSDHTESVLREFASSYDFVRFYTMPVHGEPTAEAPGEPYSVLEAVKLVRTEWVWTFGDDDLLLPGALDRAVNVISSQPELHYIHCVQAKRYGGSKQIFSAKSLLELCDTFGWIDTVGFLSSNLGRTSFMLSALQTPSWPIYIKTAFVHSCGILEVLGRYPAALFDENMVDLQDAEQTPETLKRWKKINIGLRYFFVLDAFRELVRLGVVPNRVSPAFFRYHGYHLWDRFAVNAIEHFRITGEEFPAELWERVLGYASHVNDPHCVKQINQVVAAIQGFTKTARSAKQLLDQATLQLDNAHKISSIGIYKFANVSDVGLRVDLDRIKASQQP